MAFTTTRSVRTVSAARCSAPRTTVRPAIRAQPRFVVRAEPAKANAIETAVKEAEEACSGQEASGQCAAAWDTVEEISAALSHKKDAEKADPSLNDPLEKYCNDNPEADECRVYDD
eukprot:jgi/Chrzof1/10949/Cz05g18110.t1